MCREGSFLGRTPQEPPWAGHVVKAGVDGLEAGKAEGRLHCLPQHLDAGRDAGEGGLVGGGVGVVSEEGYLLGV